MSSTKPLFMIKNDESGACFSHANYSSLLAPCAREWDFDTSKASILRNNVNNGCMTGNEYGGIHGIKCTDTDRLELWEYKNNKLIHKKTGLCAGADKDFTIDPKTYEKIDIPYSEMAPGRISTVTLKQCSDDISQKWTIL